MTLEVLIEEQKSISKIIDEKVASIREWFTNKIEEVREMFNKVKDKIIDVFSKTINSDIVSKKIDKDIEIEVDGTKKKIVNKGDSVGSAATKLKSFAKLQLSNMKKKGDSAISSCQKGIRAIMGIKDEDLKKDKIVREVHVHKVNTADVIKSLVSVFTAINATCGAYRHLLLVGGM